jgi:hypothetical protein
VLKTGVGIGDLKFGATRQQVIGLMGPPQGVMNLNTREYLQYPAHGLLFILDEKQGLELIVASSPLPATNPTTALRWRAFAGSTDRNIRIGSTAGNIEAVYGKDYLPGAVRIRNRSDVHETELLYPKLGVGFTMDANQRCVDIALERPTPRPASQP